MGKKIKIYERLLLGLAFVADGWIDIYQSYKKYPQVADSLKPLSPWLYKPSDLRRSYYYLLRTGYLEKVIKNSKPYLRLTNKANKKLKRDFPIFKMQKRKWDKKWRLVIFDISEETRSTRDLLRDKLKELGFGMLQKSIYISAYDLVQDMYEFLHSQSLLGKAFILTAKHQLMGEPKDLANQVWQVDKLQDEYDQLWLRIIHLKDKKNRSKETREIKNDYLNLIQKDPCLPYDLLPSDWIGKKVKREVVNL